MHGYGGAAGEFEAAGVQRIGLTQFRHEQKKSRTMWMGVGSIRRTSYWQLDPVFLAESRLPMKEKYGREFFPAFVIGSGSGLPFPKFFQVNRDGDPKGF